MELQRINGRKIFHSGDIEEGEFENELLINGKKINHFSDGTKKIYEGTFVNDELVNDEQINVSKSYDILSDTLSDSASNYDIIKKKQKK